MELFQSSQAAVQREAAAKRFPLSSERRKEEERAPAVVPPAGGSVRSIGQHGKMLSSLLVTQEWFEGSRGTSAVGSGT